MHGKLTMVLNNDSKSDKDKKNLTIVSVREKKCQSFYKINSAEYLIN